MNRAVLLATVTSPTPASIHGRAAAAVGAQVPVATPAAVARSAMSVIAATTAGVARLARHAEVLRQVERADEGEPEPWGGEDRVERTQTVGALDLHAGDHVVLGLSAIVGEGHRAVPGGAHHRRRAAPADGWVVGRADHRRGRVGRADARCQHTVGAGVEGGGDLVDGDV